MRIISGKYGRRRFTLSKGLKLRPTTDLAKEALFDSLNASIGLEDIDVLDLFCGTGSIGVEFISRGARQVTMVDKNPKHIAFVRQVITEIGATNEAQTFVKEMRSFIQSAQEEGKSYDVIFADPPYDLPWLGEIPTLILSSSLLKPNGLLIVEHPSTYDFSEVSHFLRHKSYSAVNFSFFSKTGN